MKSSKEDWIEKEKQIENKNEKQANKQTNKYYTTITVITRREILLNPNC